MSEATVSARSKKATKNGVTPKGSRARAKRTAPATPVSAEERRALIEQRAYFRAEARGFQGGDPIEDWLISEKEVDELLARG
ncbi:MAG TPA: DUF2934 domain-containing protein [Gammaproteobacteria bacterium]